MRGQPAVRVRAPNRRANLSSRLSNKSLREMGAEIRVLEVRMSLGVSGQWVKCMSGGRRAKKILGQAGCHEIQEQALGGRS